MWNRKLLFYICWNVAILFKPFFERTFCSLFDYAVIVGEWIRVWSFVTDGNLCFFLLFPFLFLLMLLQTLSFNIHSSKLFCCKALLFTNAKLLMWISCTFYKFFNKFAKLLKQLLFWQCFIHGITFNEKTLFVVN